VDRWHLPSIAASGKREPRVLFSPPACRAVVIDLEAGDEMGEHSVHETSILQVVTGTVAIAAGGVETECEAGTLVVFGPGERHAVHARGPARVLLLLAPWPGDGHYAPGEAADPARLPAHAQAAPLEA
jgi:quercetin dioxygenase-like cupin family protein